jgi:hypothetical protein
MKKVVVLLMFVKILVASNLVVKDGNVTVTIGKSERELPIGTTIDLAKGTKVCYLAGNGRVTIDGISRSAESKDKCYTTQKEKKFDMKAIIDEYLKNNILVKLFKKSNDNSSWTLFRGGKNEKVSGSIILHPTDKHFVIESNQWSDYPISLIIFDTNNNEVKRIVKYINDYKHTMVFDLPRSDLGNGYRVVVKDSVGDEYINIGVELK